MKFSVLAIILVAVLGAASAWGTGLVDPTRPAGAGSASTSGHARPSGPVLQSTMVSPQRKIAVISGRSYTIGDKVGGAEIIEIRSYEVVLKRAGRLKYLRLMPAVTKEVKGKTDSDELAKK